MRMTEEPMSCDPENLCCRIRRHYSAQDRPVLLLPPEPDSYTACCSVWSDCAAVGVQYGTVEERYKEAE